MRRTSIWNDTLNHRNPIPLACRIDNLVVSGAINGWDPVTGQLPATLDEQCALLFANVRHVIGEAGGDTGDIIKMTFWLQDMTQRDALNREWIAMFPDERSRPARHALLGSHLLPDRLIQCDFIAKLRGG